jgi:hypothetical protein
MADRFDADPAGPSRPLDEQLRDLARATEPLVVLAGPAAARHRGERRRARGRTAAVGAVAALALGVGCWQLLPGAGAGRDRGAPAASPSGTWTSDLPASLDSVLLPTSSLPFLPGRHWQAIPSAEAAAKFPTACPAGPDDGPYDQAGRVYSADDGSLAHYRLYAFPDAKTASLEAGSLFRQISKECVHALGGKYADDNETTAIFQSTTRGGQTAFWLDHRDRYVALLEVQGPLIPDGDKAGAFAYTHGPWTCIDTSLKRLAPRWTPSPGDGAVTATGGPASVIVPPDKPDGPGGAGPGASSGGARGPGASADGTTTGGC